MSKYATQSYCLTNELIKHQESQQLPRDKVHNMTYLNWCTFTAPSEINMNHPFWYHKSAQVVLANVCVQPHVQVLSSTAKTKGSM
jgi:hypothetical protein